MSKLRRRLLPMFIILVSLLVLVEFGIDVGRLRQYCTRCGAVSRVRLWRTMGYEKTYDRHIDEGALSKFVQEQKGAVCSHQWQTYDSKLGGLFVRTVGCHCSNRVSTSESLQRHRVLSKVLVAKAANDTSFVNRLCEALGSMNSDEANVFFWELREELEELEGNTNY